MSSQGSVVKYELGPEEASRAFAASDSVLLMYDKCNVTLQNNQWSFFQNLIIYFFGYFDPKNMFLMIKNLKKNRGDLSDKSAEMATLRTVYNELLRFKA